MANKTLLKLNLGLFEVNPGVGKSGDYDISGTLFESEHAPNLPSSRGDVPNIRCRAERVFLSDKRVPSRTRLVNR